MIADSEEIKQTKYIFKKKTYKQQKLEKQKRKSYFKKSIVKAKFLKKTDVHKFCCGKKIALFFKYLCFFLESPSQSSPMKINKYLLF